MRLVFLSSFTFYDFDFESLLTLSDVDFLRLDFTSLDLLSVYLLPLDFLPPNRMQCMYRFKYIFVNLGHFSSTRRFLMYWTIIYNNYCTQTVSLVDVKNEISAALV